jgi:hypothetical protein
MISRKEQILTMHAAFINQVVKGLQNQQQESELERLLQLADDNGWNDLTRTIRQIKSGRRDLELLNPLDEEDQTIVEAILHGLQDPSTLPDPAAKPDPGLAAPGLASMIQAAGSGNAQALQLIASMADQMSRSGGPMAQLASVIRPMINGERDPERLCKKLDSRTEAMVLGILEELKQREEQP